MNPISLSSNDVVHGESSVELATRARCRPAAGRMDNERSESDMAQVVIQFAAPTRIAVGGIRERAAPPSASSS
jgi:hypothetical protein